MLCRRNDGLTPTRSKRGSNHERVDSGAAFSGTYASLGHPADLDDRHRQGVRGVSHTGHWAFDIHQHVPLPIVHPVKFISERTERRPLACPVIFRVLTSEAELLEAARLRYLAYDIHVPYKNTQGLEFDEYDKYSIPMGGFAVENGVPRLVSFLRLVTRELQPRYAQFVRNLVRTHGAEALRAAVEREPLSPFPSSTEVLGQPRRYPASAKRIIQEFNASDDTCELSRTISHADYRGLDLSRKVMEFGIMLCLERGLYHAIGSNDPRLTPMYNKYGYVTLPEVPRIDNRSVECVSDVVFSDFRQLPSKTDENVRRITAKYARDRYFCICPQTGCHTQDHPLDGGPECPRTRLPVYQPSAVYP